MPYCESQKVSKRRFDKLQDRSLIQRYQCQECRKRFNERTRTAMAHLGISSRVVSYGINARREGMGARATGRTFGESHSTHSTVGKTPSVASQELVSTSTERL